MGETVEIENVPLWLNKKYLEDILKNYLKDNKVKIQNVSVKPATSKGENYASVMLRIAISYTSESAKTQQLSLIMKNSFEADPFVSKIMESYNVYKTEMQMYEQILPQLGAILKEAGDNEKLFANTFHVNYESSSILFEDLSVQNYVMASRFVGMNELHAKMTLKKLAKFHAASAVLNERTNGLLEAFDRGIFNRHSSELTCIFEQMTEVCAEFCLQWPELGAYYHNKLKQLVPNLEKYVIKAYNINNPKHFHCLAHGDFWVNNLMMLYNDVDNRRDSLKDVLFVDFQFCNWSTPAVDLHYFFNNSLEPNLQCDINALDSFVQYYHLHFVDTLKKLCYRGFIPSLREFVLQMEESKFLAVNSTISNLPIARVSDCDDADIHSLLDDNERARNFRIACYNSKTVREVLSTLLPYFDSHGLLDAQK